MSPLFGRNSSASKVLKPLSYNVVSADSDFERMRQVVEFPVESWV
ncbi:hypothetical protein [Scytonema sp. NUACC21]